MKLSPKNHGFTLIEILVVIGIIAILATMVLVSVNPGRQFKMARDMQRKTNLDSIISAIHQNVAEHMGVLTCDGVSIELPLSAAVIRSDSVAGETVADIAPCIVPNYLSRLPVDPTAVGAHFTNVEDYDTQYFLSMDENGHITASSTGELEESIVSTK